MSIFMPDILKGLILENLLFTYYHSKVWSIHFLLVDGRIRTRIRTNKSGCGSRRSQTHMDPTDPDPDADPDSEHCLKV
jgi:hypothetical protein